MTMEQLENHLRLLKEKAQRKPEYVLFSKMLGETEKEFEQVLLYLPDETQDVIWSFVFQCEAQSDRLLRLVVQDLLEREKELL